MYKLDSNFSSNKHSRSHIYDSDTHLNHSHYKQKFNAVGISKTENTSNRGSIPPYISSHLLKPNADKEDLRQRILSKPLHVESAVYKNPIYTSTNHSALRSEYLAQKFNVNSLFQGNFEAGRFGQKNPSSFRQRTNYFTPLTTRDYHEHALLKDLRQTQEYRRYLNKAPTFSSNSPADFRKRISKITSNGLSKYNDNNGYQSKSNGYSSILHHYNGHDEGTPKLSVPFSELNDDKKLVFEYNNKASFAVDAEGSKFHNSKFVNSNYMSNNCALMRYGSKLTSYEKKEILDYPDVYFLGLNAVKRYPIGTELKTILADRNFENFGKTKEEISTIIGFDDAESGYIVSQSDHLAYRYEVKHLLGKGSFGQVFLAVDHCTGQKVAVKIVRSDERFTRQAMEEIKILTKLNAQQFNGEYNVILLLDHFYFRGHVCMVFELLFMNLYEVIHRNNFIGCSQSLTRKFAIGILHCLKLLYENQIIHCDLKPENVLLRHQGSSALKVIDFGSSCFANRCSYTYLQSRFYRAPEIILGLSYGTPIDMWSLGCIVAELLTGTPLFEGDDQYDQLACIMEVMGVPPMRMIMSAKLRDMFFDVSGQPLYLIEQERQKQDKNTTTNDNYNKLNNSSFTNGFINKQTGWANDYSLKPNEKTIENGSGSTGSTIGTTHSKGPQRRIRKHPGSRNLVTILENAQKYQAIYRASTPHFNKPLDLDLVDFLQNCLKWCPEERMNPIEALKHPWIRKYKSSSRSENRHSVYREGQFNVPNMDMNNANFGKMKRGLQVDNRANGWSEKLQMLRNSDKIRSRSFENINDNYVHRRYFVGQGSRQSSEFMNGALKSKLYPRLSFRKKNLSPQENQGAKISQDPVDSHQYRSFLNNNIELKHSGLYASLEALFMKSTENKSQNVNVQNENNNIKNEKLNRENNDYVNVINSNKSNGNRDNLNAHRSNIFDYTSSPKQNREIYIYENQLIELDENGEVTL